MRTPMSSSRSALRYRYGRAVCNDLLTKDVQGAPRALTRSHYAGAAPALWLQLPPTQMHLTHPLQT